MSLLLGYEADIHRGTWERPQMMAAPRLWSALWLAFCLYGVLVAMVAGGVRWALLPTFLWFIGQGILVALTLWDTDWDLLLVDHLFRRSKTFYDAG